MRESVIEKYLVEQVAAAGGVAEKFKSPGRANVPDRIVSWPGGVVHFVELKAPGEQPNDGQLRDHRRRRAAGHFVWVVDNKDAVKWYIATGRNLRWDQYVGLHDSHYPAAKWIRGNGVPAP